MERALVHACCHLEINRERSWLVAPRRTHDPVCQSMTPADVVPSVAFTLRHIRAVGGHAWVTRQMMYAETEQAQQASALHLTRAPWSS